MLVCTYYAANWIKPSVNLQNICSKFDTTTCTTSLLQVWFMVTLEFVFPCCRLVMLTLLPAPNLLHIKIAIWESNRISAGEGTSAVVTSLLKRTQRTLETLKNVKNSSCQMLSLPAITVGILIFFESSLMWILKIWKFFFWKK